jgi:ATP-dependent Clp protease ATP-binding subunit ClpB
MDPQALRIIAVAFTVLAGLLYWYSRRGKSASGASGVGVGQLNNLTALAREGKLDAVIGREDEIDRLIQIIQRRGKNNPLLLGEPGVGKTAIVEGLAVRIAAQKVPNALRGKQIFELNVAELISGTKYRGEFEERLRGVMKELEKTPRESILFIDEIHLLEQTRGVEGAVSASDVLKPALARGDLSVIGATTFQEYEMFIRPNPALDRRFQPVLVAEPTPEAALAVLRGIAKLYEKHHDVVIDDDALVAAVELSVAKLHSRRLPDKAIDLIDEASAKVAIEMTGSHGMQVGLMHAAAEVARKRAAEEQKDLSGEVAHLGKLAKKYPGDPAIMSAESGLAQHEKELSAVASARVSDDVRARVLRKDVEEVVASWAALGKMEVAG